MKELWYFLLELWLPGFIISWDAFYHFEHIMQVYKHLKMVILIKILILKKIILIYVRICTCWNCFGHKEKRN